MRFAEELANLTDACLDFIWRLRDKKVDGWPLCDSAYPTIMLLSIYISVTTWLGPKWMNKRDGFNLTTSFVIFNWAVTLSNVILHYEFWISGWGTGYKVICENLDYTVNEKSLKMATVCWWFFISKYVDCVYTFFNLLKKKFYKISFQHVIHHATMVLNGWILVRFIPGGHVSFIGLANTFSHIFAYSYYAVANCAPSAGYRKIYSKVAIWINFIELFVVIAYLLLPAFYDCDYPSVVIGYTVIFTILYVILFVYGILMKPSMTEKIKTEKCDELTAFDMLDL